MLNVTIENRLAANRDSQGSQSPRSFARACVPATCSRGSAICERFSVLLVARSRIDRSSGRKRFAGGPEAIGGAAKDVFVARCVSTRYAPARNS